MPTTPDHQGPFIPALELERLENEVLHASAGYADAVHTALRSFGPWPALSAPADADVASVLLDRLALSSQAPTRSVDVVDMLPECDHCGPAVLARHAALLRRRVGHVLDVTLCTMCLHRRQRVGTSVIGSVQLLLLAETSDRVRTLVEAQAVRHGLTSPWQRDDLDPSWVQHYRACGFGGPDAEGRMSREVFGESVWVTTSANGLLHVDAEHRDSSRSASSVDNYLVPRDWTEDQVRHLLRQVFPRVRESSAYSRLGTHPAGCELRLRHTLDVGDFPSRVADDAPTAIQESLRVPDGPSLAADDARRCAQESRDPALLRRLVIEHPDSGLRALARTRLNDMQPGMRISTERHCRPGPPAWILWQQQPPAELASRLAKRRWLRAAGVHDALFSLGPTPEERWARGLRSRLTPKARARHDR